MGRTAAFAALGALLAVAAAAAAPSARDAGASLRVSATSPLTIRGTAFRPRERITLTVQVSSTDGRRVRRLAAGPAGGFTARFANLLAVHRCEVTARAVGSRGSRAVVPTPPCRRRPATLRIASTAPLTVVGTRFLAGEAVVVHVTGAAQPPARRTRAASTGRFTVTFAGVTVVDRCNSDLLVRAIGARGSAATAKIGPLPQCPPG